MDFIALSEIRVGGSFERQQPRVIGTFGCPPQPIVVFGVVSKTSLSLAPNFTARCQIETQNLAFFTSPGIAPDEEYGIVRDGNASRNGSTPPPQLLSSGDIQGSNGVVVYGDEHAVLMKDLDRCFCGIMSFMPFPCDCVVEHRKTSIGRLFQRRSRGQ